MCMYSQLRTLACYNDNSPRGFMTTGLQVASWVHRHTGAAPGDAQRFLEDGDAAELARHRHADSVQRAAQGQYL